MDWALGRLWSWADRERRHAGLGSTRDEYLKIRERWAQVTNDALRQAGLTVRVDHRSLERQGIDREPVPTMPEKVFYAERARSSSVAGDAIRARHRERLEARLKPGGEMARVLRNRRSTLRNVRMSISSDVSFSRSASVGTHSLARSAMSTGARATWRVVRLKSRIRCAKHSGAKRVD